MIDVDWFIGQSKKALDGADESVFEGQAEVYAQAFCMAAWATWNIVRTLVDAEAIELSNYQEFEYNRLKAGLIARSGYLPRGIDKETLRAETR